MTACTESRQYGIKRTNYQKPSDVVGPFNTREEANRNRSFIFGRVVEASFDAGVQTCNVDGEILSVTPTIEAKSDQLVRAADYQKIPAIKNLREIYGLGLREAKDAIEVAEACWRMEQAKAANDPNLDLAALTDQQLASRLYTQSGDNVIKATIRLRELRGFGLKEAKQLVDAAKAQADSAAAHH